MSPYTHDYFTDPATTEIYTLSLHDALPISGENDVFLDGGKEYLARYGQGTVGGKGWQSFDHRGVHFIGLVNVERDRKSTRLNSSHTVISYAVFCLKKKIKIRKNIK